MLGKGGFGEVWEAEHVGTCRRVALKLLTNIHTITPTALARFQREGQLAASLNHPDCVYVFGTEQVEGYPVIVMELMSGGTLQDQLRGTPSRASLLFGTRRVMCLAGWRRRLLVLLAEE